MIFILQIPAPALAHCRPIRAPVSLAGRREDERKGGEPVQRRTCASPPVSRQPSASQWGRANVSPLGYSQA